MDRPEIDFSECEREPIRTPGLIQARGALLRVAADDTISHVSGNSAAIIGVPPTALLGRPLSVALPWLSQLSLKDRERVRMLDRDSPVTVHRAVSEAGAALYEIEPLDGRMIERPDAAPRIDETDLSPAETAVLATPRTLSGVAEALADTVAGATGYDRVMIYRFHSDWSGEVIAERVDRAHVAFLGLRYPATDIPSQARALYTETLVRLIDDVNGGTAPVLAAATPQTVGTGDGTVDLSDCDLRAISPYHLEYLRNMGVRATLVISLLVEGRLWGLIACHHDSPRTIGPGLRRWLEALSRRAGAAIETVETRAREAARQRLRTVSQAVFRTAVTGHPAVAIFDRRDALLTGFQACGLALVTGSGTLTAGHVPSADSIRQMAERVRADKRGTVATEAWPRLLEAPQDPEDPPGLLAVARGAAVLLLYRPEQVREVRWGGDPTQPVEGDGISNRLSPRQSFAVWRETVRGEAVAFDRAEILTLRALMRALAPGLQVVHPDHLDLIAAGDLDHSISLADRGLLGLPSALIETAGTPPTLHLVAATAAFREFLPLPEDDSPIPTEDAGLRYGLPVESLLAARPADTIVPLPDGGAERRLRLKLSPIMGIDRPGRDVRRLMLLTVEDVSRQYRQQESLRRAYETVEGMLRERAILLANMSHDFRTPLNAILGYADVIRTKLFGPDAVDRYASMADDIHHAGSRLLEMVEDLMLLNRIESGTATQAGPPVDVGETLADIHRLVGAKAGRRNISVVAMGDLSVRLSTNGGGLLKTLLNVIDNAVKFSPDGGEVRTSVQLLADGRLIVEVADSGPGIAREEQLEVFKPFYRSSNPYIRQTDGTGLGLAIVDRFMASIGGGVGVGDRPGGGALIRLEFPAHLCKPAPTDAGHPSAAPAG